MSVSLIDDKFHFECVKNKYLQCYTWIYCMCNPVFSVVTLFFFRDRNMKALKTIATCNKEGVEEAIAQKACSCSPSFLMGSLTQESQVPLKAMASCFNIFKGKM